MSISGNKILAVPSPSTIFTTTAPLGVGATFTGSGADISNFVSTDVTVVADQPSSASGLVFSWSPDGITYTYSQSYTVAAGATQTFTLPSNNTFFNLVYTIGGVPQGIFSLTPFHYADP